MKTRFDLAAGGIARGCLLTGALLTGMAVAPGSAQAATCSSTGGVSVIVDFGSSIRTGCAGGDPATGWSAIESAGFPLEGTQRFPATFICRVAGFPGSADEACVQTPPASAYWAIWTAPAGGSWSYSNTGAAQLNPAPGSVIGLAFGAGRSPGMAPPTLPAPTTSTTTSTSKPPATGNPPSTSRPPTAASSTRTGSTSTHTGSPSTGSSSTTTRPATSAGTSSASSTPSTSEPGASPSTAAGPSARAVPATDAAGADPSQGRSNALIIGGGAAAGALMVVGALIVRTQRDRARRQ